jgi:hypothetical protein
MPDSKITALTSIGTSTDPANDPLVLVDVSDTSMAATGTTKKVTLNQLLACSPTATLASATITGDLTVDTSTLKVDSANNRVGIGTASPAAALDIVGGKDSTNTIIGAPLSTVGGGSFANYSELLFKNTSGSSSDASIRSYGNVWNAAGSQLAFFTSNNSAVTERYRIDNTGISTWSVGGSTAMTLNSTGLGVGGNPVRKLTAYDTSSAYQLRVGFSTSFYYDIGRNNTDGLFDFYGSQSGATGYRFGGVDGTRLTIDSSGNVGVGVTPANDKLLVSQTIGILLSGATSDLNFRNGSGTGIQRIRYTDATGGLTIGSANTTSYQIELGGSTTARAVTIDTSGNLLVGTTSAAGNRLNVQTASGDCTTLIKSQAANVNSAIDYVSSYGNHTIRKSGTASAVGVQLVSGATAWTTLSDETVKDIIEPIGNAVAKVGSLRSVIGKFKTDSEGTRRSFLIAQDVKSVLPEAVDVVGENNELGLRYTEVIPLLVAAIKELTARVQTLEAK